MTIDERLEQLTERHEALSQSVEMINARTAEQTGQITAQHASIEALRELIAAQSAQTIRNFEIALDSIRRLENIPLAHQEHIDHHDLRLEKLEGGGERGH